MERVSLEEEVATCSTPRGVTTHMSKSAFGSEERTENFASGTPAGTWTVLTNVEASARPVNGPGTSSTAEESALERPSRVIPVAPLVPDTTLMSPDPVADWVVK